MEFGAELGGGGEPGGGEVGVVEVGEGFGVHEGGFEGGGEGVVVVGVLGDEGVVVVVEGEFAEEGFAVGEECGVEAEEEVVGFFGLVLCVVDFGDGFGGEVFDFGIFGFEEFCEEGFGLVEVIFAEGFDAF